MIRVVCGLALAAWPVLTGAATITDCDGPAANARYLATPADEAVRSFLGGDVAFVGLYREEEAPQAARLMVIYPDPKVTGQRCALITDDDGRGFAYVAIASGIAVTERQGMLRFDVPVGIAGADDTVDRTLGVNLDLRIGDLRLTVAP